MTDVGGSGLQDANQVFGGHLHQHASPTPVDHDPVQGQQGLLDDPSSATESRSRAQRSRGPAKIAAQTDDAVYVALELANPSPELR